MAPSDAAPDLLAERYGRRPGRRGLTVAASIFGAALVVGVVLVGLRFADQPVRGETVSYEHIDDRRISLTFRVTARPGTPVTCGVQALDETRGQVGFTEIEVPAQESAQTLSTVEIATQGAAVSADVVDCRRA